MSQADIIALALSYLYAFALLLTFEGLGKLFKWQAFFTRKLIHIGAGMWVWGVVLLFDHWYIGVIPFATFIVLNYVFHKRRLFSQMDADDQTLGTVYFAFSITMLFLLFWRQKPVVDFLPIAVAAAMSMTWGDAMAALIGRYFGKRKFTLRRHTRSVEGSAAFVLFSFVAIVLSLFFADLYSSVSPSIGHCVLMAAAASFAAMIAEAVSPRGTDNLSVPLVVAVVLLVMW